jgi:hypothetical protein
MTKLFDGKVHVHSTGELFAVEELAHGMSEEGNPYTIYAFTHAGQVNETPVLDVETPTSHLCSSPVEGVRRLRALLLTSQELLRDLLVPQPYQVERQYTTELRHSLLAELDDLLESVEESLSRLGVGSSSSD